MTNDAGSKLLASGLSRRTLLKTGAAAAGAIAAPAIVSRRVLASSGEVNVLFWSDELPPSVIDGFTQKTGIKVNFTGFGSNEELLNKLKASKGRGYDIVAPTMNRAPQWAELELLQPLDLNKVPVASLNPGMVEKGGAIWNFGGKGSTWIPHLWGTEGIAWRTDKWKPQGEFPSYGDVWSEENAGKTMGRAHSMLLGAGLYLERVGQLAPGSIWSAYEGEEKMRPVWEKVTEFASRTRRTSRSSGTTPTPRRMAS